MDIYLPTRDVVTFLHATARDTGDTTLFISPSAIKNWTHRGYITYHRDHGGYSVKELLEYLKRRGKIAA